jgi:hypothetical protein
MSVIDTAQQIDLVIYRNRDAKFTLTSDVDITSITLTLRATNKARTTNIDATITKSIPDKSWTITFTDTQTALMTEKEYIYSAKLSTSGVDSELWYGTLIMRSTV